MTKSQESLISEEGWDLNLRNNLTLFLYFSWSPTPLNVPIFLNMVFKVVVWAI